MRVSVFMSGIQYAAALALPWRCTPQPPRALEPMPTLSVKRALLWILLAFVIAAAAFAYAVSRAGYWLEAPAQAPAHADAIVVLGGNDGDRALRALGLYREG